MPGGVREGKHGVRGHQEDVVGVRGTEGDVRSSVHGVHEVHVVGDGSVETLKVPQVLQLHQQSFQIRMVGSAADEVVAEHPEESGIRHGGLVRFHDKEAGGLVGEGIEGAQAVHVQLQEEAAELQQHQKAQETGPLAVQGIKVDGIDEMRVLDLQQLFQSLRCPQPVLPVRVVHRP